MQVRNMFLLLSGTCAASAPSASAQLRAEDRLVVFQRNGFTQELVELDPLSGQYGSVYSTTPNMVTAAIDLAAKGDWLYTLDAVGYSRFLIRLNPADGSAVFVGQISALYPHNLCANPITGELFVWANSSASDIRPDLHLVDPQTAQTTLVISDMSGFSGAVFAQAIDNQGVGWFVANPRSLHRLDLSTGQATLQGQLTGLQNTGAVYALAVSANGTLYAKVYVGNVSPYNGFYSINPATLVATRISTALPPTLAFMRGLEETAYCTAKTNSLGCVPTIGGHGYASASANQGLEVWGSNVLNNTNGLLYYGVSGRTAFAWHGGTMCVQPPLTRTPVRNSGGDPWPAQNCSGRWSLDFNTALATLPPYASGTMLDLQWFGRDNGFAPPNGYQFTDALEFTLHP